jgi:hypothetical protein
MMDNSWLCVVGCGHFDRNLVGETGIRVRVCRGVLRFSDLRIQDSRTDFGPKMRKSIDSASMRGWCKMEELVGGASN